MKETTSRRLFLRNSAFLTSGLVLLSPVSVLGALNSENCPFKGYNPYSEETTDIRTTGFLGKQITVKGKMLDKHGNPRSNITIEVWHLSPNSSKYRHRAKFKTNAKGEYAFKTDFPNNEPGMNARLYFKLSAPEKSYFTELVLNDHGAHITHKHWEYNNKLGDEMFPKTEKFLNNSTITFNLSI